MHMLTDRTTVSRGAWVLVMGASSGVGSAAIQIAVQLGARVITTGSTGPKRQLGLSLGAEAAVDTTSPDWPGQVREFTGKRGVDVVVEHVGGETLERCFTCLARDGTIVTCGATSGRELRLDLWPMFVKQQRLVGSYGRTRRDISTTLEWVAQRKLRAVVDREFPVEQTAAALSHLRSRDALGKVLVTVRTGAT